MDGRGTTGKTAKKCAIYLRVSKSDGSQTTDNQRPEVEQLMAARGYTISAVYEEQASAVKHRPMYEQMIRDAKRGKFSALGVWAIDRFGRSLVRNLQDILELDRVGVEVVSAREAWLDTGSPVRSLLVAIFSWVAEQERERLVSRTCQGLARARRQGVILGRPKKQIDLDRARELRQTMTLRQVAAELGVGAATLHRALASEKGPVVEAVRTPSDPAAE